MVQINLCSFLFYGFTLLSNIHDYYVSSTELVYVSEKEQVQLTTRIFIDDLEAFFNAQAEVSVQLSPDLDSNRIDSLVQDFFESNFQLIFDEKVVPINYLGRQYKEDQILIFAEVNNVSPPHSFEIHNTILISFREGQQNIIHFKTSSVKKSFLMNASRTTLAKLWIL